MLKNNQPLTIKDIKEVLIPAMEAVFATKKDLEKFATKKDLLQQAEAFEQICATKQDLEAFLTKEEFRQFKDEILSGQDKIIKDLEILMTEKVVANHQEKQRQKYGKL